MSKIKVPLGYFLGGESDVGWSLVRINRPGMQSDNLQGEEDYKNAATPALVADLPIGHIGSYYQKQGGSAAKAAVPFFKWQLKGDLESKKLFCDTSKVTTLVDAGWKIKTKNGIC
jgi:hypothetical protein